LGDGDGSGRTFNNDSGVKLALSVTIDLYKSEVSLEEIIAALKRGGEIGDDVVVVEGSGDGCVVGGAFDVGGEVDEDDEEVDEDEGDE